MTAEAEAHPVRQYLEGWQQLRTMRPDLQPRPNGWKYGSYEELVLDLGKPFVRKPLPTGVEPGEQGECFSNALNTVMRDAGRWRYVEGYATGAVIPVNHAWVLDTADGKIFDPTWPDDEDHRGYYGIVFPFQFVIETVHQQGVYGILANDWKDANRILQDGSSLWLPDDILTQAERNDLARAEYDGKFANHFRDQLTAIARKRAAWRIERETYL